MATSQNGLTVLQPGSKSLRVYEMPGFEHERHFVARDGCIGFTLVHYASWYHDNVERLDLGIWDEWGHAVRPVKGQISGYSNHASGSALDLNATRHPIGVAPHLSFTDDQIKKISHVLDKQYHGLLRSGIFYQTRPDGMHVEVNVAGARNTGAVIAEVNPLAIRLMGTKRGKEILAANPGLRAKILS